MSAVLMVLIVRNYEMLITGGSVGRSRWAGWIRMDVDAASGRRRVTGSWRIRRGLPASPRAGGPLERRITHEVDQLHRFFCSAPPPLTGDFPEISAGENLCSWKRYLFRRLRVH